MPKLLKTAYPAAFATAVFAWGCACRAGEGSRPTSSRYPRGPSLSSSHHRGPERGGRRRRGGQQQDDDEDSRPVKLHGHTRWHRIMLSFLLP